MATYDKDLKHSLIQRMMPPIKKIKVAVGQKLDDAKYSSDSIAEFVVTGTTSIEVNDRLMWVKKQFKLECENK